MSQRKGYRIELEIARRHLADGITAQRVPLSGAAGGLFAGDVVIGGAMRAEVKARANGNGVKILESWLGDNDLLFLRRDRAEPLVFSPRTCFRSLGGFWPRLRRSLR
jgi:hypothetical protein